MRARVRVCVYVSYTGTQLKDAFLCSYRELQAALGAKRSAVHRALLYLHICVCVSVCVSVYLPVCLFICLSVCLSILCANVCVCVYGRAYVCVCVYARARVRVRVYVSYARTKVCVRRTHAHN